MTKNINNAVENRTTQSSASDHLNSQIMASRYQSSFEHSRDAMNIFTPDRKIIDVNLALIQISGYTKQELLAMNLDDLYPETMTNDGKQRLKNLKAEIKLPLFESFLLTKNGEKIPVEIACAIIGWTLFVFLVCFLLYFLYQFFQQTRNTKKNK